MRDACATMNRNPVDKDQVAFELGELREIFAKSLAPVDNFAKGDDSAEGYVDRKETGHRHSRRCHS